MSEAPTNETSPPKLTATHTPILTDPKTKKPVKGKPRAIAFNFDFGADIDEAIKKFGKANVYKLYLEAATADVIAEAKRLLTPGRNNTSLRLDAEILESLKAYKPGTDQAAIERANRVREMLAGMSPEALAAAGITVKGTTKS